MIINSPITKQLNYLSGNRAVLNIAELPDTSFNIQNFSLPSLQLPAATHNSPYFDRPEYGDKIAWESLEAEFIVLEDMSNWLQAYNWINSVGSPRDRTKEFAKAPFKYSDATVTLYSSHNNPLVRFKFIECVPTVLGGVRFNEVISETTTVTSFLTMEYLRYDVEVV
jgi:hypothetical protein